MGEATQASFAQDLREALAAWRRFPWLPAISVGLGAALLVPDELWPVALLVLGLQAGWFGTERVCYLRAFRGRPVRVADLWKLTRAFVIRYCVLGVVLAVTFVVLFIVLYLTGVLPRGAREGSLGPSLMAVAIFSVLVDITLTFVTPALAFTTRKVRRALAIGVGMLRREWPSCAWYVLVPPLAAVVVAQTIIRLEDLAIGGQLAVSTLASLLNLWFKGATAAFYLRRHEVGDKGAAFLPRDTSGRRRSTAGYEVGLFLWEDEAENLGRVKDLRTILKGIEQIIPLGGVLYVEGGSIAPDVIEFLERNQVETTVQVAKGTIWPKPRTFDIPLSEDNVRQLVEMTRKHVASEICDHLVVYRDDEVLLTAYDAGLGSVYVSKHLPRPQLDRLRTLLRESR